MTVIVKRTEVTPCEQPIGYAYEEVQQLTREDYAARVKQVFAMEQAADYDFLVIYGDREHFSNIQYFTGYDPRWEESLLLLTREKKPLLFVGNEGSGYFGSVIADVDSVLYQTFSLMGQPNDARSRRLSDIFRSYGIGASSRVGLIGWKVYREELFELETLVTDVPHYIVETLAKITGTEHLENATALLSDCEYGLKHHVSAKEIVLFEVQGTKVSRGVYNCIKNVKPGMLETEAGVLLQLDGEPMNMHPNLNFKDAHLKVGLNSPKYDTRLAYGDSFGVGYGTPGCLVHKAGMYIRDESDLPEEKKDYLETFLKPYFACVAKWYESMKIGAVCGELYDMVEEMLGFEKFGIGLNPGHLTHTDEWTNSPLTRGSKIRIRSGMAFQCDYTVSFAEPFMTAHIEDGLVIADEQLREEVRAISPTSYRRMMARRDFMRTVLNIQLPDEVLPLSDLCGVCFPYMADVTAVLAVE